VIEEKNDDHPTQKSLLL